MSDGSIEKILSQDLKSGLKTTLIDEGGELYVRVSWINWDSGFRDSGLLIQDRIIGVNGTPLMLPEDPKERRISRDRVIGGLTESKTFAEMGLQDGQQITLQVLRRNVPGQGFTKREFTGSVRLERSYSTREGKPAIAPGGPENLGRNDVGDTWMSWLERRVAEWSAFLDGRWFNKFDSRRELASHLELKPRIDAALSSYSGEFSRRLAEDWQLVADCLAGRKVELPANALEFREQSERIEKAIAEAGDAAWTKFLNDNSAVDQLPTINLVRADRAALTGKVIALPGLTLRETVKDGDRTVFYTNHSDYHAYVFADQPSMGRFWQRLGDYQARVEPRVPEKYDVIGRVRPQTKLIVSPRAGAKIGLDIEALAVRVLGHFFVDVTGDAPFAGAEFATARGTPPPPDDASPTDVMRAYVQSLKNGDEKLWLALFADWVAWNEPPRPYYRAFNRYTNFADDYTRARGLLLHKVSHVEPAWESEPRTVLKGDEFDGAPKIEEVSVIMDHIDSFDGQTRVFNSIEVARVWTLQRRDGGPWRITSRNVL